MEVRKEKEKLINGRYKKEKRDTNEWKIRKEKEILINGS